MALMFSYGMNTNNSTMSGATRLGPAMLLNYSWEMLQFANVYKNYGSTTRGILWDIDEDMLQYLDQREGYPNFYNRVVTDVKHDGETKKALVYYMTAYYRKELKDTEPSEHYLATVIAGYRASGLTLPIP